MVFCHDTELCGDTCASMSLRLRYRTQTLRGIWGVLQAGRQKKVGKGRRESSMTVGEGSVCVKERQWQKVLLQRWLHTVLEDIITWRQRLLPEASWKPLSFTLCCPALSRGRNTAGIPSSIAHQGLLTSFLRRAPSLFFYLEQPNNWLGVGLLVQTTEQTTFPVNFCFKHFKLDSSRRKSNINSVQSCWVPDYKVSYLN